MDKKLLEIQTKRLKKNYSDIGDAVIKFSLQIFRVYSDKYYTDSEAKEKINNDWKKYIQDNFSDLGIKKANQYLKIGETLYKYQKTLNIDKLAAIRETSWLEIIKILKGYEDAMIKEILIDFQNKIDTDYAINIFKKVIDAKSH